MMELNIDNIFAFNIALNVMNDNGDHKSNALKDCRQRNDLTKCKDAIEAENLTRFVNEKLDKSEFLCENKMRMVKV